MAIVKGISIVQPMTLRKISKVRFENKKRRLRIALIKPLRNSLGFNETAESNSGMTFDMRVKPFPFNAL